MSLPTLSVMSHNCHMHCGKIDEVVLKNQYLHLLLRFRQYSYYTCMIIGTAGHTFSSFNSWCQKHNYFFMHMHVCMCTCTCTCIANINFTFELWLLHSSYHYQSLQHQKWMDCDNIYKEHSYMTHPITGSIERYIVGDHFHEKAGGHKKPTCKFHNIDLCPELKKYQTGTSEVINSKIKSTRLQSSNQQNLLHYFLYNRLMDYWHNMNMQRQHLKQNARFLDETVTIDLCTQKTHKSHLLIPSLYYGTYNTHCISIPNHQPTNCAVEECIQFANIWRCMYKCGTLNLAQAS